MFENGKADSGTGNPEHASDGILKLSGHRERSKKTADLWGPKKKNGRGSGDRRVENHRLKEDGRKKDGRRKMMEMGGLGSRLEWLDIPWSSSSCMYGGLMASPSSSSSLSPYFCSALRASCVESRPEACTLHALCDDDTLAGHWMDGRYVVLFASSMLVALWFKLSFWSWVENVKINAIFAGFYLCSGVECSPLFLWPPELPCIRPRTRVWGEKRVFRKKCNPHHSQNTDADTDADARVGQPF